MIKGNTFEWNKSSNRNIPEYTNITKTKKQIQKHIHPKMSSSSDNTSQGFEEKPYIDSASSADNKVTEILLVCAGVALLAGLAYIIYMKMFAKKEPESENDDEKDAEKGEGGEDEEKEGETGDAGEKKEDETKSNKGEDKDEESKPLTENNKDENKE